jgi:ATP-dependent exoDNAse (exonuclease V) alpha subunit
VPYIPEQFNNPVKLNAKEVYQSRFDPKHMCLPFDYCYAVTCHKSQEDEGDTVMLAEEYCSLWERARWAYTAASRAKKRLIWIMG